MNIGITTSVIQRAKTGVGQYLVSLVKALLPHAARHRFFLFVLEGDRPIFAFAEGAMRMLVVPERMRAPLRDIGWHQTTLVRWARAHALDVLHVPSYRRMLWRHPCALVATIHDLAPFHLTGKYDLSRMFYCRSVVPWLARRQQAIITPSQATAADVKRFLSVPSERLHVIHNGIDQERFRPGSRDSARLEVARKHQVGTPFILYVARLEHPGKNHVRLIRAFEDFKRRTASPWSLVFCGSDWHGAEAIHQAIRSSPYATSIRSLGFVSEEDLPELYRAARLFIYPSLYEGFGFPPLEAMACGCPVISSARGSLGEVVGDAARIIDPEDFRGMADALCSWHLEEQPEQWSLRGLRRAAEFGWDVTASRTVGVYESLAGSGGKMSAIDQPAGYDPVPCKTVN